MMSGYPWWIEIAVASLFITSCVHSCDSGVSAWTDGYASFVGCGWNGVKWCNDRAAEIKQQKVSP